jgi:hypothetical protein
MSFAPINSKQRLTLLVGGIIIGAMLLFPPWIRYGTSLIPTSNGFRNSGYSTDIKGYAFIFIPPSGANRIDTTRLLIQLVAVGAIVGGLFFFLKDRQ